MCKVTGVCIIDAAGLFRARRDCLLSPRAAHPRGRPDRDSPGVLALASTFCFFTCFLPILRWLGVLYVVGIGV
jgi:hypothetical protein